MAIKKSRAVIGIAFATASMAALLNPSRASAQSVTTTEYGCSANAAPNVLKACRLDEETYDNHFLKGDYDGSIKGFTEAITADGDSFDPGKFVLYLNRGNSYTQRGFRNNNPADYELAVNDYLTGIRLQPNNAPLHDGLALTYERQGKLNLAIREFTLAIQNTTDKTARAQAYFSIGQIYERQARSSTIPFEVQSDLKKAEENYQLSIDEDPLAVRAQEALSSVQKETGDDLKGKFRKFTPGFPAPSQ